MPEHHEVSFRMTRGVLRRLMDSEQYLGDHDFQADFELMIRANRLNTLKQSWTWIVGLPPAVLGLLAFKAWLEGDLIQNYEIWTSIVIGLGASIGGILVSIQRSRIQQLMRAQTDTIADQNATPGFLGPATVRADDQGLHCSHHTAATCFHWPAIQFIREGRDIDALWTADSRVVGVPHEAHESPEARTAFLDFIRAKHEEHGGTGAVMRRFLADHDLNCQQCGYGLKGTDGTCPECGTVRPVSAPGFD